MIGTIAFTSAFSSQKSTHNHHEQHHQQQFQQQQIQTQLSRSTSVLQRLKSINLNNLYTFYSPPPTTHFQHPQPEPEPEPEPKPEETNPQPTAEEDEDDTPSMEEIYNRIKQSNQVSHYGRQNSDTKPSGGEVPVKLPQKMKKSASHKSAFNHFQIQKELNNNNNTRNNNNNHNVGVNRISVGTVEEEEEREKIPATFKEKEEREDEGVDAKADDFINRFKKQLRLQRIDSIVRYKEMISRTFAQ
ncbi:Uncharacterized protein RDABS01_023101 [Bienertia sinuspersici]